MYKFLNNLRTLFWSALLFFLFLTLQIAILPALEDQRTQKPLKDARPLTINEKAGRRIFVEEGCIACHTQQVRNVDMDRVFGERPSLSADYANNHRMDVWRNTANLLGSERTGPDLTNIGARQPSDAWHLVHLYQPRAAVAESVMPAYKWLFVEKDFLEKGDVEVKVPEKFLSHKFKKIVATRDALNLVAYLKSLRQVRLPDGTPSPEFMYRQKENKAAGGSGAALPDGGEIYTANCVACHQANGEGLQGAFPPLKGSPVVNGNDLKLYVTIIMKGYDPRPQWAAMPNVGETAQLTPEQVTALMNHERSSWGNTAPPVKLEDVKKIMETVK